MKKGSIVLEKPCHSRSLPDVEAMYDAPTGASTDRRSDPGRRRAAAPTAGPGTCLRTLPAETQALLTASGLAPRALRRASGRERRGGQRVAGHDGRCSRDPL